MELVARLKAAEETFVLATVVRTRVGDRGQGRRKAIHPARRLHRGGPDRRRAAPGGAVLKAAREALADGEPRMVSVQPENLLAEFGVKPGENRDGVRFAQNMCPSKGTMDIFCRTGAAAIPRWSFSASARWRLSPGHPGAAARLSRHGGGTLRRPAEYA